MKLSTKIKKMSFIMLCLSDLFLFVASLKIILTFKDFYGNEATPELLNYSLSQFYIAVLFAILIILALLITFIANMLKKIRKSNDTKNMNNIVELKIKKIVNCLDVLFWAHIVIGIVISALLYNADVSWVGILIFATILGLNLVVNRQAQKGIKTKSRLGYVLSQLLFSIFISPILFPFGIYGLYNLMNKELRTEVYKKQI